MAQVTSHQFISLGFGEFVPKPDDQTPDDSVRVFPHVYKVFSSNFRSEEKHTNIRNRRLKSRHVIVKFDNFIQELAIADSCKVLPKLNAPPTNLARLFQACAQPSLRLQRAALVEP